jgi:hypothetical protein
VSERRLPSGGSPGRSCRVLAAREAWAGCCGIARANTSSCAASRAFPDYRPGVSRSGRPRSWASVQRIRVPGWGRAASRRPRRTPSALGRQHSRLRCRSAASASPEGRRETHSSVCTATIVGSATARAMKDNGRGLHARPVLQRGPGRESRSRGTSVEACRWADTTRCSPRSAPVRPRALRPGRRNGERASCDGHRSCSSRGGKRRRNPAGGQRGQPAGREFQERAAPGPRDVP